jgi:hypothetical protein
MFCAMARAGRPRAVYSTLVDKKDGKFNTLINSACPDGVAQPYVRLTPLSGIARLVRYPASSS